MELLRAYGEARQALLEYFNYPTDYGYPIDDCGLFYWWIDPLYPQDIQYGINVPENIQCEGEYTETVDYMYPGPEYTLVECVDPTGGYMLLIFDNSKQLRS